MGTDSLKADSRFDFLSLFNPRDEDEDDAVAAINVLPFYPL